MCIVFDTINGIWEPGGEPVLEGAAADGAPAHGLRDDPVEAEPELRPEHAQPHRLTAAGRRHLRRPVAQRQPDAGEHRGGVETVQSLGAPDTLRREQPLRRLSRLPFSLFLGDDDPLSVCLHGKGDGGELCDTSAHWAGWHI
jgi:hypothetical protein